MGNKKVLDDVKERLATLWKDFEDRSESVVDILAKTMETGGGSSRRNDRERNLNIREEAIKKYEEEMIGVVRECLRTKYRDKFRSDTDLNHYAVNIVKRKILDREINQFIEMEKSSWSKFLVSESSRKNVVNFMSKLMKHTEKK